MNGLTSSEAPTRHKVDITVADRARFAIVACYLSVVLLWLWTTGQLRVHFSVRKLIRSAFRARVKGTIRDIEHESGLCYTAAVDARLLSDAENASRLKLFEDDIPLPNPHVAHEIIRVSGGGAYSHWGDKVYFSTTDGTDPRANGRRYTFIEAA